MDALLVAAAVPAVLAALLHVYIFVLESLRWEDGATRRTFATTAEQASATREMAYNQGFYNLFLAVVTLVGVGLLAPVREAGVALVVAGTGSMLAAALVLITSDRTKARPAAVQGTLPAVTLVLLALAGLL
ncbi:DUF1304 domain-containing protein [Nocardioides aurantiacus]|uniref:Putative membrane protein n=1 Tax=Nocardioides aurantiacus TaxID=86796 RepID=A0A3N2CVP7_9ACTN|nr:DUF1304 domain-containing protein [Nocardioides aurantiacus]ROR91620.1 putative membrane protein [Nocardioides aurantiacus]